MVQWYMPRSKINPRPWSVKYTLTIFPAYAANIELDDIRVIGFMLFSLHPLVYRAHRGQGARLPFLVQSKTVWNALYVLPPESKYVEVFKPLSHPQTITNKFMLREPKQYIEDQCNIVLEALRRVRLMVPMLEGLDKSEVFFRMLGTSTEMYEEDRQAMRELMKESSERGGRHSKQLTQLATGIRDSGTEMSFGPVLEQLVSLHRSSDESEACGLTKEIIQRYTTKRKLSFDMALRGLAHRIVRVIENHNTMSAIQEYIREGRERSVPLDDIRTGAKGKFAEVYHDYIDSQIAMVEIQEYIREGRKEKESLDDIRTGAKGKFAEVYHDYIESQIAQLAIQEYIREGRREIDSRGGFHELLDTIRTNAKAKFPVSHHGYIDGQIDNIISKNDFLLEFLDEINKHKENGNEAAVRKGFELVSSRDESNAEIPMDTLRQRMDRLLDSDWIPDWIRAPLERIWSAYRARVGQMRADNAPQKPHFQEKVHIDDSRDQGADDDSDF